MFRKPRSYVPLFILLLGVVSYILYFSLFTVNRYQKLYAHYFDLGIMHHAVYNTYMGIKTRDMSRILEITDPHNTAAQVKRMSVHNDVTLALIAPLYFIHDGPETLLVLQSIIIGFGALYIYYIALSIIPARNKRTWFALIFAYSYLLYPALQKANNFDFHAVMFATTFLLAMYYYWLTKKYGWSIFFAVMSVFTKEQVGLTVAAFGVYVFFINIKHQKSQTILVQAFKKILKNILVRKRISVASSFITKYYALIIIFVGLVWTYISMVYIIPYFRGSAHFGMKYYTYLREDPLQIFPVLFRYETWHYIFILLAPVGLLALGALPHLLIIVPEFAINILSSNENMRNIYFHYDAVLTPFIFIASIYGVRNILNSQFTSPLAPLLTKEGNKKGWFHILYRKENILLSYLVASAIFFSLSMSPLPWGKYRDMYPWQAAPSKLEDVLLWKKYLSDDLIKVSATGRLAPYFTSRRYFYNFSWKYTYADYVIVDTYEVPRGFMKEQMEPAYNNLQKDWRYIRIYDNNDIEVYKKINNEE